MQELSDRAYQMYQQEGAEVAASRRAMDSALMEYLSRARAALNQSE